MQHCNFRYPIYTSNRSLYANKSNVFYLWEIIKKLEVCKFNQNLPVWHGRFILISFKLVVIRDWILVLFNYPDTMGKVSHLHFF